MGAGGRRVAGAVCFLAAHLHADRRLCNASLSLRPQSRPPVRVYTVVCASRCASAQRRYECVIISVK